MNAQIYLKKLTKKPVLALSLLTILTVALMIISLFLPAVKVLGESFNYFELEEVDNSEGLFAMVFISCAISLIFPLIQKKWAAIVGAVYAIYPIVLFVGQTIDWCNRDFMSPMFGSLLISFLSIVVLVLNVAKFILLLKTKKQAKAETIITTPPVSTI